MAIHPTHLLPQWESILSWFLDLLMWARDDHTVDQPSMRSLALEEQIEGSLDVDLDHMTDDMVQGHIVHQG